MAAVRQELRGGGGGQELGNKFTVAASGPDSSPAKRVLGGGSLLASTTGAVGGASLSSERKQPSGELEISKLELPEPPEGEVGSGGAGAAGGGVEARWEIGSKGTGIGDSTVVGRVLVAWLPHLPAGSARTGSDLLSCERIKNRWAGTA